MKKKIAVYVRSNDCSSHSIKEQKKQIKNYVNSTYPTISYKNASLYSDCGVNGLHLNRPALQDLREDVVAGHYGLVVATSPDRLSRSYYHLNKLEQEFTKHNTQLVYVECKKLKQRDVKSKLIQRIITAIAEEERELLTRRLRHE